MNRLLGKLIEWLIGCGLLRFTKVANIEMTDPKTGERTVHPTLADLPPEIREKIGAWAGGGEATATRRVYRSLDEVPPEIRAKFEAVRRSGGTHIEIVNHTTGQAQGFRSLDDVPPEIQAEFEKARQDAAKSKTGDETVVVSKSLKSKTLGVKFGLR